MATYHVGGVSVDWCAVQLELRFGRHERSRLAYITLSDREKEREKTFFD